MRKKTYNKIGAVLTAFALLASTSAPMSFTAFADEPLYGEDNGIALLADDGADLVEYTIKYVDYDTKELIQEKTIKAAPIASPSSASLWVQEQGLLDYSEAPYGHKLKSFNPDKLYSDHVLTMFFERQGYRNVPAYTDVYVLNDDGFTQSYITNVGTRVTDEYGKLVGYTHGGDSFFIPQPVLDDNRDDDTTQYADNVLPYIKDIHGYRFVRYSTSPGRYVVNDNGYQYDAGLGVVVYDLFYEKDNQPWTVRGIAADPADDEDFAPHLWTEKTEPQWVLEAPDTIARDIEEWYLTGEREVDYDNLLITYRYAHPTSTITPPPVDPDEEIEVPPTPEEPPTSDEPPTPDEPTTPPAPQEDEPPAPVEDEPVVPADEEEEIIEDEPIPETGMLVQTGDTNPVIPVSVALIASAAIAATAYINRKKTV